jgi:hypothetical protein
MLDNTYYLICIRQHALASNVAIKSSSNMYNWARRKLMKSIPRFFLEP